MRKSVGWLTGLMLAVVGCAKDVDLNSRPLFSNGVNSLTFLLYDGATGAPISGATLTMNVGAYELAPTKVKDNAYVISQVPPGTQLVQIHADGYIDFTGQAFANCGGTLSNPASQCYVTYQAALFPVSSVKEDFHVKVFNQVDGSPVTSGSVVATLTSSSSLVGIGFSNPLPGTLSVRPNVVVAQIGADGVATLPKEQLVLGGQYSVDTFGAKDGAGHYLVPTFDVSIAPGQGFPQLTLFVGAPSETPRARSANNETPGVRTNLVVEFPYPVEVCSKETTHSWYISAGGADGNSDGIHATVPTTNAVTAAANGGTLTLTANFATSGGQSTFQPADGLLEVTFTGVQVRAAGASGCYSLGSLPLRNSGTVSASIRMANPL